MTQEERIWNLVKEGWTVTSKGITDSTDMLLSSVSSTLCDFQKAGLIDHVKTIGNRLKCYKVNPQYLNKPYATIVSKIKAIRNHYTKQYSQKKRKRELRKLRKQQRQTYKKETISMVTQAQKDIEDIELLNYFKDAIGEVPRRVTKTKIRQIFEEALAIFK